MQHRMTKIGLTGAGLLALSFALAAPPALADFAPQQGDVVGVGSDTVQYASDFVADGSYAGNPGYNTALNHFAVVNFDATPDANARLAYGPQGVGTLSGVTAGACAPGTGSTNGTGNQSGTHADKPCALNPTVVLQAGTKPVQRPNGSGAGAKALQGDTANGNKFITYARASSCQDTSCAAGNPLASTSYDVLKLGTDPLAILNGTTTNVPPLSNAELANIYKCNYKTWGDVPGYSGSAAQKAQFIVPIIPQVGSGTRSSFESTIGIADSDVGTCVQTGEENDPTAIDAAVDPTDDTTNVDTSGSNTVKANALEPMSGGRLNMFNGLSGATNSPLKVGTTAVGGYFQDPSCPLIASGNFGSGGDCASSTALGPDQENAPLLVNDVQLVQSGTPPDGGTVFGVNRSLYVYFRSADVDTNAGWQPGSLQNQIRTLFYNPCDAYAIANIGPCVTVSGQMYGPGGQPYYLKAAGQTDIAAAGINPTYVVSTSGANGL